MAATELKRRGVPFVAMAQSAKRQAQSAVNRRVKPDAPALKIVQRPAKIRQLSQAVVMGRSRLRRVIGQALNRSGDRAVGHSDAGNPQVRSAFS